MYTPTYFSFDLDIFLSEKTILYKPKRGKRFLPYSNAIIITSLAVLLSILYIIIGT